MSTTDYCSTQDVIDRLSENGVRYHADDDADGVVSTAESEAAIAPAIRMANAEIDEALCRWLNTVPIVQNESSLNAWLRERAIALAAEYVAARGGSNVPTSLTLAADRARASLVEVRLGPWDGIRVPGLTYPGDEYIEERRCVGVPRVANPDGGSCGRSGLAGGLGSCGGRGRRYGGRC